MTNCFRLSSGKYPAKLATGAALHGGRWNPKGVDVIYAAATASLAALEILVHYSVLPRDFVLTPIRIPAAVRVEVLGGESLPADWNALAPTAGTQEVGRRWAEELRSAVLNIPSAIVPTEWNYLLNPKHPVFGQIKFLSSIPFRFDPRLK